MVLWTRKTRRMSRRDTLRSRSCERYSRRRNGTKISHICREHEISEAPYYIWSKRYADLGLSELRELRQCAKRIASLSGWVLKLPGPAHAAGDHIKACKGSPLRVGALCASRLRDERAQGGEAVADPTGSVGLSMRRNPQTALRMRLRESAIESESRRQRPRINPTNRSNMELYSAQRVEWITCAAGASRCSDQRMKLIFP